MIREDVKEKVARFIVKELFGEEPVEILRGHRTITVRTKKGQIIVGIEERREGYVIWAFKMEARALQSTH